MHQSAIVHSNSGHCRPALTGLYLPPAPFDRIYIAAASYDGEDRRRLPGGRGIHQSWQPGGVSGFSLSPQRKWKHFILEKQEQ